ncbi:MAG: hypothetical protein ABI968_08900 [Acidobacteriota bacterium]
MDANKPHGSAHEHGGVPGSEHGGVAAEPDRVSSTIVVGFAVLLAVFTVVSMLLVAALFKRLDRSAEKKDDATLAAAALELREDRVPPLPRLQVYPARHWQDFRAAEAERLSTYGWMDRARGAVHVPIERAMDLIAVRGVGPLPAAPVAVPEAQAAPGAEVKP